MNEFQGAETVFPNENIFKHIFGRPKTMVKVKMSLYRCAMLCLFQRDPVATVDVRVEILTRRLAASTGHSVEQKRVQEELRETLQVRRYTT